MDDATDTPGATGIVETWAGVGGSVVDRGHGEHREDRADRGDREGREDRGDRGDWEGQEDRGDRGAGVIRERPAAARRGPLVPRAELPELPERPEALRRGPFTVAQWRTAGLPAADLRRAGLHAPTRAVRTASVPTSTRERALAFAVGLPPDAAFSHVTAAVLLRLPLPAALEAQADLDVMRPTSVAQARRRGCHGHRGLESREVLDVAGLRVVGPADTWVDLAGVAHRGLGVDDLVIVGDVVANRLDGGLGGHGEGCDQGECAGLAALTRVLEQRTRPRGKALLEQALPLVRVGSRSPMETRARLMFHRAGFPEPELNAAVRDDHGEWLLEGDLVWRAHRVVGEYQGSDHASRRRRSSDAARSATAEDHDHRVLEIHAEDVFGGARRRALLRRFARAMMLDLGDLTIE
ncbi:hypothetical protein GCM10023168_37440 [Fodinibacter luteus]|uniref:DUF559 domain-containing protein n=1 Tax=Fodinibacter luteus TaxID=552064 RepID=A0ABP8KS62_9MICO